MSPRVFCERLREGVADPQHAFPGHGQSKPEQQEVTQLRREAAKLKAERDILEKPRPIYASELQPPPFWLVRNHSAIS